MKMKRCNKSGCRNLIPLDEKYCDEHKAEEKVRDHVNELKEHRLQSISKGYQVNKDRYTRYAHSYRSKELGHSFYQKNKWKILSDRIRKRDLYTCQVTQRIQMPNESFVVDHIVPRLVAPELSMVEANLWLLSREIHQKKTAEEQKMTAENLRNMTKYDWIKLLKK